MSDRTVSLSSRSSLAASHDEISSDQRRRVVLAGAIGSTVEFYDFGIYGYLATTIAGLFFPTANAATALLATLALFATAFVVRPIGSVVFGHVGDRYGRKPALAVSVIMMAIATFAIGLLPTAGSIGVAAPILLLIARLVQGLSAGGEVGGAATMLAEASRSSNRGFLASATQCGSLIGLLLASGVVVLLTTTLPPDAMKEWGWRIAFILALPTGLVGLYIRSKLEDTAQFERLARTGQIAKVPAIEAFRTSFVPILKTFGISVLDFVAYYFVFVYLAIYMQTQAGISRTSATWATSMTLLVAIITLPCFGWLSDKVGRRPVIAGSGVFFLVAIFPALRLIHDSGSAVTAGIAQIVLGLGVAAIMGPLWATVAELFPTRVRYSGMGIAFSLAAAIVGGTTPYMASWIQGVTGNPLSPAYLVMASAVVTLLTLLTMRETAGSDLPE
jgi:MHS family proline/betaine transporter-like MFS transporter